VGTGTPSRRRCIQAPKAEAQHEEKKTMETMILALAAVLSLAAGTVAMSPSALD
jgi:hypothetical protein